MTVRGEPELQAGTYGSNGRHDRPCGLLRRLLAMVYDTVLVLALLFLAAVLVLPLDLGGQQAFRDPVYTLYLAAVWFGYLAGCWRRAGMTLGMRAWRIRLITDAGEPPAWWRCGVRFLVSLVSAATLGAGFLWSVFDRQRRTWHDRVSGTRLVRIDPSSDGAA